MEMNKTRTLIREQRLEKFARILSNRYNIELKLSPATHKVGCCDTNKKIWISSTIDQDPVHNLLLQKATALHELGHMLYTKNTSWTTFHVSPRFANVIEDGRVEEAVSRMFPKARLYFIYLNRKLNPVVIHFQEKDYDVNLPKMIYDLVFREAKRNVGIPQFPINIKVYLKKKLGDNYDWIINETRCAVNAKTEDEAAKISHDLEQKIIAITQGIMCSVGEVDKSMNTCGTSARQMPQMKEDDILKKLKELEEIEKQEIDNEIKAEEEEKKLEESLKEQNDDTKISVEPENPEDAPIQDVSVEEEMIDDFFGGSPQSDNENNTEDEEDTDDDITETGDTSDKITGDVISFDDDITDAPITASGEGGTVSPLSQEPPQEQEKSLDDIAKEIEDSINSIAEQAEDRISKDAEDELRNENDTIQSGEVDPEFETYDTVDEDDLRPTGKYGVLLRPVDTTKLDPIARKISRQFKIIAQFGDGWVHNQTRGRIEMNRIHTIIDKNRRARIFRKKDEIKQVDLSVAILLDASGSMTQRRFVATDTAYIISRALELGGYRSEVVQFGVNRANDKVYGIKSFNQKTQYARKRFKPVAVGCTPLLSALEGAEKSLANQDSKRKVCFVVTDGDPCYPAYKRNEEYTELCRKQIMFMEREGITVVGVIIQTWRNKLFHKDRQIHCQKIEDVEKKMLDVLKKVLIKLKET